MKGRVSDATALQRFDSRAWGFENSNLEGDGGGMRRAHSQVATEKTPRAVRHKSPLGFSEMGRSSTMHEGRVGADHRGKRGISREKQAGGNAPTAAWRYERMKDS